MRSLISLSLFALAFVAAAADEPDLETRALSCGIAGHNAGTGAYWWSLKKDTNTLLKCAEHCKGDRKCKSYAFGQKEGKCLHYSVEASKNARKDAKSLVKFYEKACLVTPPTPSSSSTPSSTPLVSNNARCGKQYGGRTCKGSQWGNCCSQNSYCGSSIDHCRPESCQKGYGDCGTGPSSSSKAASSTQALPSPPPSSTQPVSKDARCGKQFGGKTCKGSQFGNCCSQYSYCGSTKDYCRPDSCQKVYGDCDSVFSSSRVSSSSSQQSSATTLANTESSSASVSTSEFPELHTISSVNQQSSSSTTANEPTPSNSLTDTSSETPTSMSTEKTSSVNNDSPPYTPSGGVVMPSDPAEFIATYTWQDDPLPTPVEMGTPPIMSGASAVEPNMVKKCMVDPIRSTFELLDADDRIPLMKHSDGSLGGIKTPKSEEEFLAMGSVENLKFASFSFVAAENGLFDLVINESPRQYVAKKPDGSVILTDSSTGADPDQLATSIFEVTCEGRITVRIDSQHYTWKLRENDSVMQTADGKPDTMWTLPDSPAVSKRQRRSKSQEGIAPRCNNHPRDLDARVFDGARKPVANQCGSSSFNVPDLSFGGCCDQHDYDYDNCGMTFEEGNDRFLSCMSGSGCDSLNHWYLFPLWVGCLKTAEFYYSVVSSYFGMKAFYEANTERCKCYCPAPTPHACMINNSLECLDVLGTDTNNCGACGRKCPEGGRCAGGQCKCYADQCGDRCVTLASHPRNCGQCGRVSPSGYCVQGQFYNPPAFCTRGEGFSNGHFADGKNSWNAQITGGPSSTFRVGSVDDAGDADKMVGIFDLEYADFRRASLKTQVKMCPGLEYDLSLRIRKTGGGAGCVYTIFFARERRVDQLAPYTDEGLGWQLKPEAGRLRVGPFDAEEREGVSVTGPELWVDFELQIMCEWGEKWDRDVFQVDQFTFVPA